MRPRRVEVVCLTDSSKRCAIEGVIRADGESNARATPVASSPCSLSTSPKTDRYDLTNDGPVVSGDKLAVTRHGGGGTGPANGAFEHVGGAEVCANGAQVIILSL